MDKKLIINILKESMIQNKVIAIYTNKRNLNLFSAGIVIGFNEEEVLLRAIDYYGEYDGYIARKINTIINIDSDSKYNTTLYKLYKLKKQIYPEIEFKEIHKTSIYRNLLENAKNNKLVVLISTIKRKEYVAYIEAIEENIIYLDTLNQYGNNIKKCTCALHDVLKINCDTKEEQCIKLLNKSETNS